MIKRVLMVDDDPTILFLLTQYLAQFEPEFQLTGCSSASEAMVLSQTQTFDLLITDYLMPGLNGLQLVSALRERQPELKFILVTGLMEEVPADELSAIPLIGFIPKPFTLDLVSKVVRAVIAN